MTEQALREKFIELSAAQLENFGVDGSPYIVNRFAVLVWKNLQPSITQYGDTREREGRIDELENLIPTPVAEMASMNHRAELEQTFDGIRERLAELKEEVK